MNRSQAPYSQLADQADAGAFGPAASGGVDDAGPTVGDVFDAEGFAGVDLEGDWEIEMGLGAEFDLAREGDGFRGRGEELYLQEARAEGFRLSRPAASLT